VATVNVYDGLGRVTRKTKDANGIARNTDHYYDKAGRMTRITDDLGQSTDYAYDERGRLSLTTYADSGTVAVCYAFGTSPMRSIDQRAITKRFDYDGLGRLITKGDAWTSATIVERYEYDKLGRRTLAILTNGGTEQADDRFYYNALGRLTRESQQVKGGTAGNVDALYDKAGNRTKLAYPGASRVVNYTYDAGNRISLIKNAANTVNEYKYIGPARVSERKYVKASDGSTEVTTLRAMYDGVANITRFYHDRSDDSVVVGFKYDHDKVGNPEYKLREHQSNEGDEYTYDDLYRLTRSIYDDSTPATPTASPGATSADDFMYDDIGNRTKCYLKSANDTTYLHNTVNEYTRSALSGTDAFYGSDAAGNLTRVAAAEGSDMDGDWRYYYDYENFLTKAEKYDTDSWLTQAEFVRDALGRRIDKVAGETTVRYYLDGWRVIEETEGTESPTVERQYVFGNGINEALLMFDKDGESHNAYYYLADRMWTVEALVDEDAAIVESYVYRAYGEPTIKTADGGDGDWFDGDETTATSSAYGNTILFTGRNWDAELSLYYYRARVYDPIIGRYLQRDKLQYFEGMCMYLYVRNNPPMGLDPWGLATWQHCCPALFACTTGAIDFGNGGMRSVYHMLGLAGRVGDKTRFLRQVYARRNAANANGSLAAMLLWGSDVAAVAAAVSYQAALTNEVTGLIEGALVKRGPFGRFIALSSAESLAIKVAVRTGIYAVIAIWGMNRAIEVEAIENTAGILSNLQEAEHRVTREIIPTGKCFFNRIKAGTHAYMALHNNYWNAEWDPETDREKCSAVTADCQQKVRVFKSYIGTARTWMAQILGPLHLAEGALDELTQMLDPQS